MITRRESCCWQMILFRAGSGGVKVGTHHVPHSHRLCSIVTLVTIAFIKEMQAKQGVSGIKTCCTRRKCKACVFNCNVCFFNVCFWPFGVL